MEWEVKFLAGWCYVEKRVLSGMALQDSPCGRGFSLCLDKYDVDEASGFLGAGACTPWHIVPVSRRT